MYYPTADDNYDVEQFNDNFKELIKENNDLKRQIVELNSKMSHSLGTTGVCTMSSDHSATAQNVVKTNGQRCHITIDTTCELIPNNGWLSDAGITIPEGFRPATSVMVPCWIRGTQYHQSVTALISSSGKITIYAGSDTTMVKSISMRCEYLL